MKKQKTTYEIATFDSDTSGAQSVKGGMTLTDAMNEANKLWETNEYYGVEVVSQDPNDPDPIQWIRTKSKFIESYGNTK